MPNKPTAAKAPLGPPPNGAYGPISGSAEAQLPAQGRVQSSVSSIALDQGLLARVAASVRAQAGPVGATEALTLSLIHI